MNIFNPTDGAVTGIREDKFVRAHRQTVQGYPSGDWRTVALSGGMRKSLGRIAELDFLFTTEAHGKNLSDDSHLLVPERRGTSELKLSATIFHLPSDCFTHTAMSLPLSSIGAPLGVLIVIWYL